MLRIVIASLTSVFLCLGFITAASAFVAQPLLLDRHSADAEIICAGCVIKSTRSLRDANGSAHVVHTLRIDRVLKGAVAEGTMVYIEYVTPDGYPRHLLTGYDLVFLKKHGTTLTFARPCLSSMPVAEKSYVPYPQSDDLQAKLRWEVINSLHDTRREVVRQALRQTSMLSYEDILTYVKPRTATTGATIRDMAYRACIDAGDSSLILPAIHFVVEEIRKSGNQEVSESMDTEFALRNTVLRSEHTSYVISLLNSDSLRVRRFASFLLRKARDVNVVPALKGLLDDSDFEVRYNAIMGLSEVIRDFAHGPSIERFRQDESYYIGYWKDHQIE